MKTCTQFTSNGQCSKPCHHWGYFTLLIRVVTPCITGRGGGSPPCMTCQKILTILMMAYFTKSLYDWVVCYPHLYTANIPRDLVTRKFEATSAASRLQIINEGPKHTRTERQSRKMGTVGTENKQPDKVVLIF